MAENPATWGPLEHTIADTIERFAKQPDELIGFSLPRMIADALRAKFDVTPLTNPVE